jgi:hypothetical protein
MKTTGSALFLPVPALPVALSRFGPTCGVVRFDLAPWARKLRAFFFQEKFDV